jgi:hypothetical protein
MPYDMFVRAQLAGDQLDEKVRDKAVAAPNAPFAKIKPQIKGAKYLDFRVCSRLEPTKRARSQPPCCKVVD